MPVAYRKLSTAALGVTLLTLGTVLSPIASAAAAPQATLSLSSPAAGARGVTYTVQFTPAATLNAGTGKLTLTGPKGTRLPAAISDVFDVTASQDLGGVSGGKLSASGATATWTVAAAIPAGHVIDLTLAGAANPPAGTYSIGIASSAQKATIATAPYHVTPPRAVRSPIVSFAEPVVQGDSDITFPVRFTTSPSGALVAGHGTITLTAAKGTILPFAIGDLYDATTGTDLGPLSGGVLTDNGAAGTWKVAKTIPAGHVIDLRLDGVNQTRPGSYKLGIATSSDTVTARASYTIFAMNSPLQISGFTSIANESDHEFGPATVQTCSNTGCVTSQSSTNPLDRSGFTLFVPGPGEYTVTAYPAATDTSSLGQETIGPFFVSGKSLFGDEDQALFGLPFVTPEPAGVTLDGQSATIPDVSWDSPAPLSVPGCAGGAGVAVVSGFDPSTGTPDIELGRLAENPAGSGTYTATVPPQYPTHGTITVTPQTACAPPTALLPASGPAGGGNEVQLTGQGFTGATAVLFGGKPAKSFTVASDTQIDAMAPAGSGTVGVSVVTPGGTILPSSLSQYRYLSVGTLFPASGPAGGGQTVTLTGSGFSGIQAVYFGTKPASHVDVVSATQITATVPAGKPGTTVPVTILADDGGQSAGAVSFTYWNPSAPAVPAKAVPAKAASASPSLPSAGRTAGGAGAARPAGLAGPAVSTGGFTAVDPFAEQVGMAGDLVAKMASNCAGAGAGTAFAAALNRTFARVAGNLGKPQGWVGVAGGLTGSAAAFLSSAVQSLPFHRVLEPLLDLGFTVPELIAIGTTLGTLNGLARNGVSQSALGTDLNCAEAILYRVVMNATSAAGFTARVIPSGTVVDTKGNPVPGATVTLLQAPDLAQPFSVVAAATPGVEPQENPQTTDSNGTFGWDLLGGRYELTAQAPGCTAPGNPGQAVVTSPAFRGLPPTAGLVLTLSCPGEAPPSAPAVTGLSTASGPASGGTQVDVQGTGFTGSAAVTFGSRSAAAITVLSPTELAATAPAGTGTVDVRVRTAAGTSAASGADRYTYAGAPAVTRITPLSGPAGGGTVVTVTGAGFAAGDQVTFGSALAGLVTVASGTRIVAVSPPGVGPAAVAVSSPGGVSKPVTADIFKFLLKPSFTSAAQATAVKGKAFRFTVRTTGYPVPLLTWSGNLPRGLRIAAGKDKGNGTAVISGTPSAAGRFVLRLHARNSLGTAGQTLTITVKT